MAVAVVHPVPSNENFGPIKSTSRLDTVSKSEEVKTAAVLATKNEETIENLNIRI